jgi:hypothetical protein
MASIVERQWPPEEQERALLMVSFFSWPGTTRAQPEAVEGKGREPVVPQQARKGSVQTTKKRARVGVCGFTLVVVAPEARRRRGRVSELYVPQMPQAGVR